MCGCKSSCKFCGGPMNADGGILGTGICFSKQCRDRMNQAAAADAALKRSQAEAISKMNSSTSSGLNPLIVASIVVTVIILIAGIYILIRRNKS